MPVEKKQSMTPSTHALNFGLGRPMVGKYATSYLHHLHQHLNYHQPTAFSFSPSLSLSFHVSGLLQDRPSHQGGPSKRHSVCLLQQCRQPQRVHRQLSHPPGRLQLHGEALRGHQLRETHHVPHQFQLQWRRRMRARRFASSQPSWAGRSGECLGMRWRWEVAARRKDISAQHRGQSGSVGVVRADYVLVRRWQSRRRVDHFFVKCLVFIQKKQWWAVRAFKAFSASPVH